MIRKRCTIEYELSPDECKDHLFPLWIRSKFRICWYCGHIETKKDFLNTPIEKRIPNIGSKIVPEIKFNHVDMFNF